jgi:hypothetical protein
MIPIDASTALSHIEHFEHLDDDWPDQTSFLGVKLKL